MSLDWALYYDDSGYTEITDYVLEITPIEYSVDSRTQGSSSVMQITIDSSATYGTGKYKLELGNDYMLYYALPESIENLQDKKISITLVDYFYYLLTQKEPYQPTSYTKVSGIGGAEIDSIDSDKNFIEEYTSSQGGLNMDSFSSRDNMHYCDGLGTIIQLNDEPRYSAKGALQYKSDTSYPGYQFVEIDDVLNSIISAESLTGSISSPFSSESKTTGTYDTTGNKKVWDVKPIRSPDGTLYIGILESTSGNLTLELIDSSSNYSDDIDWVSRDWDETTSGVDRVGYSLWVDPWNSEFYVPFWYASSYSSNTSDDYLLRVAKVSVNNAGALTKDYTIEFSSSDYQQYSFDRQSFTNDLKTRDERWGTSDNQNPGMMFNLMHLYADTNVANVALAENGFGYVTVSNPDKKNAGTTPHTYKYSTAKSFHHLIANDVNGRVVTLTGEYGGSGVSSKDFFKVDMQTLDASHALYSKGGSVAEGDDPINFNFTGKSMWREAVLYRDGSNSSGEYYNRIPIVPGLGGYVKVGLYNKYNRSTEDAINMSVQEQDYAGAYFDRNNQEAFVWQTNTDTDPTLLTWKIKNIEYKRAWMYQPGIYEDRKQQFIDGYVAFGYFYEQRNGNVNLIRFDGSGYFLGTITDVLLEKSFSGLDEFANEYTMQILGARPSYGSGTKKRNIKTILGEQGWIDQTITDVTIDWVPDLNASKSGKELHIDLEEFYNATSLYLPDIGDKITYDSNTYQIIKVKIDIENWIIEIKGVDYV